MPPHMSECWPAMHPHISERVLALPYFVICARLTWGHALGHMVIGPCPKGYRSLGGMSDPAPFQSYFNASPYIWVAVHMQLVEWTFIRARHWLAGRKYKKRVHGGIVFVERSGVNNYTCCGR